MTGGREDLLRQLRDALLGKMRLGTLLMVGECFEEEFRELVGQRWTRKRPGQPRSGGSEKGSIFLEGRRVPVTYPRVVDENGSWAVPAYAALRSFDLMAEEVQAKLVRGISTRDYSDVVGTIVEGTGVKRSTVSRAFIRASQKALDDINGRDLAEHQFLAMFIDGLSFADVMVVAAMGVTPKGEKVVLGLVEGHTENAEVVSTLLQNLVDRGLVLTDEFLAVIDGSKALRRALMRRWAGRVQIQRCQVHKKRNVAEHLPRDYAAEAKRRMNTAYGMKDLTEARKVLNNTVEWLRQISEPAAASLREGLEETLTVVRLGLPPMLRRTFATTNALESVFDGIRYRTGRVKRWRRGKGQMVLRWTAAAALETEKRLHRIRGHRLLPQMIQLLKSNSLDQKKEVG